MICVASVLCGTGRFMHSRSRVKSMELFVLSGLSMRGVVSQFFPYCPGSSLPLIINLNISASQNGITLKFEKGESTVPSTVSDPTTNVQGEQQNQRLACLLFDGRRERKAIPPGARESQRCLPDCLCVAGWSTAVFCIAITATYSTR